MSVPKTSDFVQVSQSLIISETSAERYQRDLTRVGQLGKEVLKHVRAGTLPALRVSEVFLDLLGSCSVPPPVWQERHVRFHDQWVSAETLRHRVAKRHVDADRSLGILPVASGEYIRSVPSVPCWPDAECPLRPLPVFVDGRLSFSQYLRLSGVVCDPELNIDDFDSTSPHYPYWRLHATAAIFPHDRRRIPEHLLTPRALLAFELQYPVELRTRLSMRGQTLLCRTSKGEICTLDYSHEIPFLYRITRGA